MVWLLWDDPEALQGSEDAGWEGFWTGLGDLGQSAGLARTVELWGDRPDVWVCLFVRGSGTTAQEGERLGGVWAGVR